MEYLQEMVKEKETENQVRFKAIIQKGIPPVLTTIYVPKWVCEGVDKISITITI